MSAPTRDQVAAALHLHRYLALNQGGQTGCRGCTWTCDWRGELGRKAHAAHLADVVAEVYAGVVEAVAMSEVDLTMAQERIAVLELAVRMLRDEALGGEG